VDLVSGTYHEISYDHCGKKERYADVRRAVHAVPHRLYPLAAQNTEDDHERVQEIAEVPQRHDSALRKVVQRIIASEQLHAHDGEDEDDDGQYEAEVAERA